MWRRLGVQPCLRMHGERPKLTMYCSVSVHSSLCFKPSCPSTAEPSPLRTDRHNPTAAAFSDIRAPTPTPSYCAYRKVPCVCRAVDNQARTPFGLAQASPHCARGATRTEDTSIITSAIRKIRQVMHAYEHSTAMKAGILALIVYSPSTRSLFLTPCHHPMLDSS